METNIEKDYLGLLNKVLKEGEYIIREDITSYIELQGETLKHDMRQGFPLLTTKEMPFEKIKAEFEWMYNGDTNIKFLNENGIKYWDMWADENGDLGPVYGAQFRGKTNNVDQIKNVIQAIKDKPLRRRHMINLWNVLDIDDMSLPPCVFNYQFIVKESNNLDLPNYLDIIVYQRSADLFLGLPFDIAQAAMLLTRIAEETNLMPRYMTFLIGSAHLYDNHLEQAKTQISRTPGILPYLEKIPKTTNNWEDIYLDWELKGYNPQERISGDLTFIPKGEDHNEKI